MMQPETIVLPDTSPRAALVYDTLIGEAILLRDPDTAFARIAGRLGAEPAMVKAFAEEATLRRPFDADGRPVLGFDPGVFDHLVAGRVSSAWGAEAGRPERLKAMRQVADQPMLKACAWGRFQLMGFDFQRAGHRTLRDFVLAMCHSEWEHLRAFESFIRTDKTLHAAVVGKDFKLMARRWCGPSRSNRFSAERIEAAYLAEIETFEGEETDPDEDETPSISAVSEVQALVAKLGFDPGPHDGSYGPKTKTALKDAALNVLGREPPSNLRAGPKLYAFATELRDAAGD